MAVLIRPKKWDRWPPANPQLDRSHPLARGLLAAWVVSRSGGGALDRGYVSQGIGPSSSTWLRTLGNAPVPTADGYALRNANENNGAQMQTFLPPDTSTVAVLSATARVRVNSVRAGYAGRILTAAMGAIFGVVSTTAGKVSPVWSGTAWSFGPDAPLGKLTTYSAGVNSVTGDAYAQAGRDRAESNVGAQTAYSLSGAAVDTVGYINGDSYTLLFHNRLLTEDEVRWLDAEPYAFLQPQNPRHRVWLPYVAASTNAPADAASGTVEAGDVSASTDTAEFGRPDASLVTASAFDASVVAYAPITFRPNLGHISRDAGSTVHRPDSGHIERP